VPDTSASRRSLGDGSGEAVLFTQVKSPLVSRHGATRARPLVVSRSGTVRQVRPPPGSQAIPRLGAGRVSAEGTPGRADAISMRSAQPAEPTRGAGASDASWGTGAHPRFPRGAASLVGQQGLEAGLLGHVPKGG
jgi:hypothetical protein